jgi:hypothetical protein
MSVAQAAMWLGVTEDAVRKRIHRGKIRYEQDPDGRYWIYPTQADKRQDRSDTSPHDRLIVSLEEQNRFLREQLEAERETNRENRRLLAAALERIPPQLEAPGAAEARDSTQPVSEGEERVEPRPATVESQEPVQKPWWRRVFGR